MTTTDGSITFGSSNLDQFAKSSTRFGELSVSVADGHRANNVLLLEDPDVRSSKLLVEIDDVLSETARTRANEEKGKSTRSETGGAFDPKRPEALKPGSSEVVTRARLAKERLRIAQERHPVVEVLERWYGVVTEIEGDRFRARIASTSERLGGQHHEGEYPISSVSPIDKDLFEVGGQFVFTVGKETRLGVQTTFSRLLFRRMPTWQQKEVLTAQEWGKEIARFLRKKALRRDGDAGHTTGG